MEKGGFIRKKAWVVTADMGYGHKRAVYPLLDIAFQDIIAVGSDSGTSEKEQKLWKRILRLYEFLSRAQAIPIIGTGLFKILDFFLRIPSMYPERDQSGSTFQLNLLYSGIKKGLCSGMMEKIWTKPELPLVTSFYAPAVAAKENKFPNVYCIICDSDLNRVWVPKEPEKTRLEYFAPCGRAARRLIAYGVPDKNIHLTGFPLPLELIGDRDLNILKQDIGQRLFYLDPNNRFWPLHARNIEYFIGKENCFFRQTRKLTITYAVGGAGAQWKMAEQIALSLKDKLEAQEIILNLVAGSRREVKEGFVRFKQKHFTGNQNLNIIYAADFETYIRNFNQCLRTTDILWTKPSELSFYCALGIPIIMSPPIGSQEKHNRRWLFELQAAMDMQEPKYTCQWLMDLLYNGRLAEAAWAGFLKARKYGTYHIIDFVQNGKLMEQSDPLKR